MKIGVLSALATLELHWFADQFQAIAVLLKVPPNLIDQVGLRAA